ncbi:hypothetical protein TherJR_2374 [Calderihabitans maritimus]|uniref:Uncharacterized protein n=1 Tax=Calderihabitans maritimus TaxID=1246530 RepID=A0A1Z5HPV2_9FIRM|nr:hypothetical protein TherJR_2374 [Calderihabitans maritimus]
MERFEEVNEVQFIPEREAFVVDYRADEPLTLQLKQVIEASVLVPGVRKELEKVGTTH